ncbi:MAG: TAT-variant-translocated molybdopterin oxidoreductase [Bacteroidota bacterium]
MSETTPTTTYWKSLNELAENQEYKKYAEREFTENATELNDGVSRRGFLRVMGASIALAGFAACRRPVQKILPYSRQPEDIVPGIPLYYATSMPLMGSLVGLVAENHEGRPTKLEGNDMHPASRGGTNAFHQAAILNLYDPDRSRFPRKDGQRASLEDFSTFLSEELGRTTAKRILFISEANSSPTLAAQKAYLTNTYFDNAEWVTYEAFGEENAFRGTDLAFGSRLRPYYKYDQADVVVSLNDDMLSATHPNNVEYSNQITGKRKVTSTKDTMSRIYAVEDSFSVTGSYADNRLRLKASQIPAFTFALAQALSEQTSGLDAFSGVNNSFVGHEWISALAEDLLANRGRSAVSAGLEHAPEVHAAVAAMNVALGNAGNTVDYLEVPHAGDSVETTFEDALTRLNNDEFDVAVIVGGNPVYTSPELAQAIGKVETVVHLSDFYNETSKAATWHINRAHFLETWGDGYSFGGTRSVIQPQIQPLHGGISEIEFLSMFSGSMAKGYDLVRNTFAEYYNDLDAAWVNILHDGIDRIDSFAKPNVRVTSSLGSAVAGALNQTPGSGMEVVIRPDASVYDGRFANNGWLQELPDPMTKITWDNVALMSPATAAQLGVENEDVVSVTVNESSVTIAAWIQPGHVDDAITLSVGYGREGIGRVANRYMDYTSGGSDTYPLRAHNSLFSAGSVSKTGETYEIACVQDHHSLEGRDLYRQATIEKYKKTPEYASFAYIHKYEVPGLKEAAAKGEDEPISLFDEQVYPEYEPQWGMAIDLNSCFGCGVCIIACQSENNIPVIGKKEVKRGREMHWIRNDRYFVGEDADNPQAVHQPVPCMHCELAPCEQVCPVAATTHSNDGMNQMTYNRCIGTRYCANNCPYKVRRFNFFNYPKEYLTTGDDPDIIQMAMNPEVTVRFRGVMEKCTYCAQRVNRAKISAKIETGSPKPADGTVKTACQQACPADCISFGDLTDPNSEVSKIKRNERNYQMLEELNTRPRTSYVAKLTNPNPALA